MSRLISAHELRARLPGSDEIAVIDVREAGRFGVDHLLAATPCPYSELELHIGRLVPRLGVPIVLVTDASQGAGPARRLAELGYTDVRMLDGGMEAWRGAGYVAFKGVNVPSKAFGEILEHARDTPAIDPHELEVLRERGPVVVLDGRTPAEHRTHCIPGALMVPNGDLLAEVGRLAPDPTIPVVVHCAGRTRSIVGAQTLKDAGLRNPVFALRGGTMAWRLSGRALELNAAGRLPVCGPQGTEAAALARDILAPHGTIALDWSAYLALDRERRTVFVIDVRSEADHLAGRIPGSVHAPGGQLVQATDQWIGVLNALVVLVDEAPHARAAFAAHWLRQMGHDARVLTGIPSDAFREVGQRSRPEPYIDIPRVAAADLAGHGGVLLDVSPGMTYRAGHIPGARWVNRSVVPTDVLASSTPIVVASDDDVRARLVAADLRDFGPRDRDVRVLAGGHAGWCKAGHPLAPSPEVPSDGDCIDHLFWVAKRHQGDDDHAREYLAWEAELPGLVARDGTWPYRLLS